MHKKTMLTLLAVSLALGCGRPESGATPANEALREAKEHFTCEGKPIHPRLVYELMPWMSDPLPTTVAVDVLATRHSNEYYEPDVKVREGWIECDVREYRHATADERRFGYQRKGRMDDGTQVLRVYSWPGGSGVFIELMFVRFDTERALDMEMKPYTRLLMKPVCLYGLGDNDDAEVRVLPDRVIVGPSRYRDREVVLKLE